MRGSRLEEATLKVGGRLKLTVLLQKRMVELKRGAPKLVDYDGDLLDVAIEEVIRDKISLVVNAADPSSPEDELIDGDFG